MIENNKIIADYHVHFGQFYDVYYQPATVIKILAKNGIREAWGATTTDLCWNSIDEKKYILKHIADEVQEAIFEAKKYNINFVPLYRVSPKGLDGKHVADIMESSFYKGFKIHPKDDGYENDDIINAIMDEVCQYASKKTLPVLIHTGVDAIDAPKRFEKFFSKYPNVRFILAHCKDVYQIVELFSVYDNVFGDTAFCPQENYKIICNLGYKDKIHIGTDFPITQWFEINLMGNQPCEDILSLNYQNVLKNIENMIF